MDKATSNILIYKICGVYFHFSFFLMLQLSQVWPAGVLSSQFLCPLISFGTILLLNGPCRTWISPTMWCDLNSETRVTVDLCSNPHRGKCFPHFPSQSLLNLQQLLNFWGSWGHLYDESLNPFSPKGMCMLHVCAQYIHTHTHVHVHAHTFTHTNTHKFATDSTATSKLIVLKAVHWTPTLYQKSC